MNRITTNKSRSKGQGAAHSARAFTPSPPHPLTPSPCHPVAHGAAASLRAPLRSAAKRANVQHQTRNSQLVTRNCRPGFSLIELLVVIGVIILLVGLVLAGITTMQSQAFGKQTKAILKQAKLVETEYQAKTGSVPQANDTDLASGASNSYLNIERFVYAVRQVPSAKQLLDKSLTKYLKDIDNDGFDEIVDAWGHPIDYHPLWNGNATLYTVDPSGKTVSYTLQPYPKPFFASAGNDGKFGTVDQTTGQPTNDTQGGYAKDNVYSFGLE